MTNSRKLYDLLISEKLVGAKGAAFFQLRGLSVPIESKSVFGNLIQEWLNHFMQEHGMDARILDNSQKFPDFYLHPTSDTVDLLEVKCFTDSPNFDIANFQAYARSLLTDAYRLDANYLIFKYGMLERELVIENVWLKKVWEIACGSERSEVKMQWKQNVPVNIRPATWYSRNPTYPAFGSRRDFVLALKKIIDVSPQCGNIRRDWFGNVSDLYNQQTGNEL